MELAGVTRLVSNLEASRQFYEEVLGFESGPQYDPTRWQAFNCQDGVFFAIGEEPAGSTDEVAFVVADIEALWERVKDRVNVVSPLEKTPWNTYRFVIQDPDGNRLAFGEKQ